MSSHYLNSTAAATPKKSYFGWVIVTICTLLMAITYGLMYSYGVFFKPLADHFDWDRATVSSVYSVSLIMRGAISIGIGWLADRYGAVKLMVFCGFMIGMGLVLSSQVHALWQFFLTYALIEATGLSGTFSIATAVTSRWFIQNRGLALGIVSSGTGLGTLFIVPGAERLINNMDWSQAFIICGIAAGVITIVASLFLGRPPQSVSSTPRLLATTVAAPASQSTSPRDLTLVEAVHNPRMIIMITVFMFVFFCTQIVIVHLYNFATDIGINPMVAASFVSIIGIISIGGRLSMGIGADRIGIYNTLIFCCALLSVSLVCLIFTRELWAFYLFAVLFGFAYGGEVPQIPLLVSKFSGTKSMATLVGLTLFIGNIGGALGPWVAGKIFDLTSDYQWAFIIGALAGLCAVTMALILKRQNRETS